MCTDRGKKKVRYQAFVGRKNCKKWLSEGKGESLERDVRGKRKENEFSIRRARRGGGDHERKRHATSGEGSPGEITNRVTGEIGEEKGEELRGEEGQSLQ